MLTTSEVGTSIVVAAITSVSIGSIVVALLTGALERRRHLREQMLDAATEYATQALTALATLREVKMASLSRDGDRRRFSASGRRGTCCRWRVRRLSARRARRWFAYDDRCRTARPRRLGCSPSPQRHRRICPEGISRVLPYRRPAACDPAGAPMIDHSIKAARPKRPCQLGLPRLKRVLRDSGREVSSPNGGVPLSHVPADDVGTG